MKRIVSFLIVLMVFATQVEAPVNALFDSNSTSKSVLLSIQNDLQMLNDVVSAKYHLSLSKQIDQGLLYVCDQEIIQIENRLLNNGIKIATPQDIASWKINSGEMTADSAMDPPDLSNWAQAYTIYYYDGTYTYNGSSVQYRYLTVIDNKGSNRMTKHMSSNNFLLATNGNYTISQVLQYNFQYILDAFIGIWPSGKAISWGVGLYTNVFSQPNAIYSSGNYYKIDTSSVTMMKFCYVLTTLGYWDLIASDAYVSMAETHMFRLNVNGSPVHENTTSTYSFSTGKNWFEHYEYYLSGHYGNYVYEIGTIKYKGIAATLLFAPCFAPTPFYL